ncbi:HD domain-containing phosphohydrolase [Desulfosediminicola ganghwensis]|uniref:HD domain-containing phosphohydrolase n=1 Tax=Desulfosediminicola ganghwensis TaxID=2569540 RepID=UPI0010ABE25C|nr:HD domain-containing phosphohydrolase [Desulfosediminicola ganghwensis]
MSDRSRTLFFFKTTILLLILLTVPFSLWARSDNMQIMGKNFLILNSYGADFSWTNSQQKGAMSVFQKLDMSNTVRFAYMDSKSLDTDKYYKYYLKILQEKFGGVQFDGVLATDNDAMLFLSKYGHDLFGDIPILATGINGYRDRRWPQGITYAIKENASHLATLQEAIRLQSKAKNCYIIVDTTTTGNIFISEIQQIEQQLSTKITFHYLNTLSFEELIAQVALGSPDDIYYLLPFFKDAAGNSFSEGRVARSLAQVSPAPIFVSWNFQLNRGTLGGAVLSGYNFGVAGATALLDLINGKPLTDLSEKSNVAEFIIDYEVAGRYGIKLSTFPKGVKFINKPPSFIDKHIEVLLPGAIIILILTTILALIAKMLNKEHIINKTSQQVLRLKEEIIDTQRELVTTLGEVIESRSNETSNHVKRVAQISRLLGEKIGLPKEDLDLLEMASPLHDVGKIAIPDAILNSPDKLSDTDFATMKQHTSIGKSILQFSNRKLLAAARYIAHQHHERWNGTGYPQGKSGEEIHIFARITTLADVYDALSNKRSYKEAWPEKRVLEYLQKESGEYFDPELVRVFIENIDEVREIRLKFMGDTYDEIQEAG